MLGPSFAIWEDKMAIRTLLLATTALTFGASSALAETEIQWWHAMGGTNGERVDKIAADFNATQSEYKITPVYKATTPKQ